MDIMQLCAYISIILSDKNVAVIILHLLPDVTIKADVYWPPLFPDILKTTFEKK